MSVLGAHLKPVLAALAIVLVVLGPGCGPAAPSSTAARPTAAAGRSVAVTDVVGRTVNVKTPAERIILGEARQLYVLATIEPEDPFRRIVGWPDDLRTADLDAYDKYKARFPKLAEIPIFGSPASGQFSVERAIELKPDVVVLNFDSYDRARESGLIDQLARAGIPSVVIDFRQYPLENTVPSTILMGKLTGKEQRAQQVVDYYIQQLNQVYSRLEKIKGQRPTAFLYRAAGISECCGTFGRANLGLLFERAGGKNLASDLLPGWSGTLNPEKVLVSDPDLLIVTGSNWKFSATQLTPGYIRMGYEATAAESRAQLKALVSQPGWGDLKAVKNGRVHAIWHQFYNSPYHFVALQQFAKWAFPEEFRDVDPEQNFKDFHAKFLPVEYGGAFWVSLNGQ